MGAINMYKYEYELTLKSGMFWEFYPWATGDWEKDKERFIRELKPYRDYE